MEVGTKQLSLKNTKETYKLFNQSYELYCIFWGLNMYLIDTKDTKWIEDSKEDIKKIVDKVQKNDAESPSSKIEENNDDNGSTMAKLKNFVKKAVDCCIE